AGAGGASSAGAAVETGATGRTGGGVEAAAEPLGTSTSASPATATVRRTARRTDEATSGMAGRRRAQGVEQARPFLSPAHRDGDDVLGRDRLSDRAQLLPALGLHLRQHRGGRLLGGADQHD